MKNNVANERAINEIQNYITRNKKTLDEFNIEEEDFLQAEKLSNIAVDLKNII